MQDGCSSKSIVHMSHVRDEKGIMKEEDVYKRQSTCCTVGGDGRERKDRLIISDTQTFYGV